MALEIAAYASGSSGNCYTVTDGKAVVMLDCGLPFREIQKLTGYRRPDAVLVTHEHRDHSWAAAEFMRRGVDVYMTKGTAEALQLEGHRLHIVERGNFFRLGQWGIGVFPTEHDAAEPCGFLIDDLIDRVLYATDTYYLRNKFGELTKIMIEANHSYDLLQQNVDEGIINPMLAERLTKSHMSIENVVEFLKVNDLRYLDEVWLLHLSDNNSDAEDFRRRVAEVTGKPVYVAGRYNND